MSGQFFCPLRDTESECDGLVSYDRAVWKIDPGLIKHDGRYFISRPSLDP